MEPLPVVGQQGKLSGSLSINFSIKALVAQPNVKNHTARPAKRNRRPFCGSGRRFGLPFPY
jgi:hypothetical protein